MVYGVVALAAQKYVLAVTKSLIIGLIWERKIYQIERLEFFPIKAKGRPGEVHPEDRAAARAMAEMLTQKHVYYSFHYDLTNSLERFVGHNQMVDLKDSRFWWNQCWVEELQRLGEKARIWVVGFISGYVNNIKYDMIGSRSIEFVLISRRDKHRQGMRFISRGCDLDGHCSNTVETEQLLHVLQDNLYYSFVQTRGSMPFRWTQKPDLKWSPKAAVQLDDEVNAKLMAKHLEEHLARYKRVALVNLIDFKGSTTQRRLGEKFDQLHGKAKKGDLSRLIWFDFHHECRNMKYENLIILLEQLSREINEHEYFCI